jgi:hypothetical protein
MSRFIFSATVAIGMALSASAFAQSMAMSPNATPACQHTAADASQNPSSATNTMAGTTSDAGNTGAGASSASIATGSVDKTGVMSPCAPAGNGVAKGALPDSSTPAATP